MPQLERGVYEPPEDSRVFDGAEDEADDGGSRLTLLILIALVVLAAFFGVVWLAYYQGVQHGRAVAPRVVGAQEGPNQREVPFKGLKIYQQPAPADGGASDEDTAPQPPTMISPTRRQVLSQPQLAAGTPSSHVPFAIGLKARSGILRPAQGMTSPSAPTPAKAATQRVATKPPVQLAQAPTAAPAPTTSAPATPSPVAAKPETAAPSRHSGAFVLQIGAYKSEAEARAAWRAYESKHPLVGGYEPDIRKADLAGKGTWYRLRIGSFANSAEAGTLCEKLKADGATCFPAKH
jgi:cell division protein FtsN